MTIAPGLVLPESEVAAICRRYQVKELALFGSAARELSELLGRKVDLVSKRALRNVLREEVLSQACYIYAA